MVTLEGVAWCINQSSIGHIISKYHFTWVSLQYLINKKGYGFHFLELLLALSPPPPKAGVADCFEVACRRLLYSKACTPI